MKSLKGIYKLTYNNKQQLNFTPTNEYKCDVCKFYLQVGVRHSAQASAHCETDCWITLTGKLIIYFLL